MKKTNLEVRLLAVNTLNKYAKFILDHEVNHFSKFVGQDILTVNLKLKKKFEHESLPEFSGFMDDGTHFSVNYWIEFTRYSFSIHIKSCVNGGSYEDRTYFCQYYEDTFYPFSFDNGLGILKLTGNWNSDRINAVFNESDLLSMAQEVIELEKMYDKKTANIPYQFREVLNIRKLQY